MTVNTEKLDSCIEGKASMQSSSLPTVDSRFVPNAIECETESSAEGLSAEPRQSNACCSCQAAIADQFMLKIGDEFWHEACMRCSICQALLSGSCFTRDGKLFCKKHSQRTQSVECSGCKERISSNELVMRANQLVYHLRCFKCSECGNMLEMGEEVALRDNRLYCKDDYDFIKLERASSFDDIPGGVISPATSDHSTQSSQDDKRGIKRPRTILTSSQRKAFKMSFEISPKPCRKVREELSKETGLSVRVVQVWFQNQRAKLKKLARKSNPGSEGSTGKKESSTKTARRKSKSKVGSIGEKNTACDRLQDTAGEMLSLPPPDTIAPYQGIMSIQENYHQFPSNMPPQLYPPGQLQPSSCPNPYQGSPPSLYRMQTAPRDFQFPQGDRAPLDMPPDQGTIEGYSDEQPGGEGQQNHLQLMHHMLNSF